MQAERTRWTDERIDDLAGDLKSIRTEMKEGFAKVDARFDKIDARFAKVDVRFDKIDARLEKMNHLLLYAMASFLIAIAAGQFAG